MAAIHGSRVEPKPETVTSAHVRQAEHRLWETQRQMEKRIRTVLSPSAQLRDLRVQAITEVKKTEKMLEEQTRRRAAASINIVDAPPDERFRAIVQIDIIVTIEALISSFVSKD
jgi:hypothetical protein